jgi:chemotaxis family two-component system response regulator Rcp1
MAPAKRRSEILLVEDNRADATLLQMSLLRYCALPYLISVVGDGEAALTFLQQTAPYADAPRPDLIILDVGLPKKDGWEVLAAIRVTPALSTIPVVMLTGIMNAVDEEQRDRLHPTCCLLKPTHMEHYLQLVRTLEAVLSATESPTPQPQTEERVLKRGTPPYTTLKERVEAALTETKEAIAAADETMARTRKVLQATEETFQHLRARREREAEQPPSSYHLPCSVPPEQPDQTTPSPARPAIKNESA